MEVVVGDYVMFDQTDGTHCRCVWKVTKIGSDGDVRGQPLYVGPHCREDAGSLCHTPSELQRITPEQFVAVQLGACP